MMIEEIQTMLQTATEEEALVIASMALQMACLRGPDASRAGHALNLVMTERGERGLR